MKPYSIPAKQGSKLYNERQNKILDLMFKAYKNGVLLSPLIIYRQYNICPLNEAYKHVNELIEKGYVRTQGRGSFKRWMPIKNKKGQLAIMDKVRPIKKIKRDGVTVSVYPSMYAHGYKPINNIAH